MHDPVQHAAVTQARLRPIQVVGGTGTGKSRLAAAIAQDAASRGLTCLLFGSSRMLDEPFVVPPLPGALHPLLQARERGLTTPVSADPAPLSDDPVALRAALDRKGADLALRILAKTEEYMARFSLDAAMVESLARPPAMGAAIEATLRLAIADARAFADEAISGNERPAATMASIERTLAWDPGSEGMARILTAPDEGPLEGHLAAIAEGGAASEDRRRDVEALLAAIADETREGMTVRAIHDLAADRARLASNVAIMVATSGTVERAREASEPTSKEGILLANWGRAHPGLDGRAAVSRLRQTAAADEERAERLAPHLAAYGNRTCADVALIGAVNRQQARAGADVGKVAHALRSARHAGRRFLEALPSLRESLPEGVLTDLMAMPVDAARAPEPREVDPIRLRAADALRGMRAEFASLGYGDAMAAAPGLADRIRDAIALPERGRSDARPASPVLLDILLPETGGAFHGPTRDAWDRRVVRLTPAEANDGTGAVDGNGFDVVVVDDAADHAELLGRLGARGKVVHLIGTAPNTATPFVLNVRHRQLDTALQAMAARGPGARNQVVRHGAPIRGGLLALGFGPDADHHRALRLVERTVEEGGLTFATVTAAEVETVAGEVDVVVVDGHAPPKVSERAARMARRLVVSVSEGGRMRATPQPAPGPETDGLSALGWRLAAASDEGRTYERDGRQAMLMSEPTWQDMTGDGLMERLARLRGLGWEPVVDWIGSPRTPAELDASLASTSRPVDAALATRLETLEFPDRDAVVVVAPPVGDVPFSGLERGGDADVRWRLAWVRDNRLAPQCPDVPGERGLLSDPMIEAIVAHRVASRADFMRLPVDLRLNVDSCQMPFEDLVYGIVRGQPHEEAEAPVETGIELPRFFVRGDEEDVRGGVPAAMIAAAALDASAAPEGTRPN